jgi:hypothetical protein
MDQPMGNGPAFGTHKHCEWLIVDVELEREIVLPDADDLEVIHGVGSLTKQAQRRA